MIYFGFFRAVGNGSRKATTASLALQIVHVDSVDNVTSEAKEPLTLADEMASFEYIDELAASTVTSYSSFSDFGKKYMMRYIRNSFVLQHKYSRDPKNVEVVYKSFASAYLTNSRTTAY